MTHKLADEKCQVCLAVHDVERKKTARTTARILACLGWTRLERQGRNGCNGDTAFEDCADHVILHILHDVTTKFTVDHPYSLLGDLG